MLDQPFFSGALYFGEFFQRDGVAPRRGLGPTAERLGLVIDLMYHRVAMSELYRDSPTRVRCEWAFADFVTAYVVLDHADEERARAEQEAGRGR